MMAKGHAWTRRKTFWVTAACGLGHVGSSVLVGMLLIGAGTAWSQWDTSSWATFHELRGSVAAWLDRCPTTLAGASLVLCGAGIRFLGL